MTDARRGVVIMTLSMTRLREGVDGVVDVVAVDAFVRPGVLGVIGVIGVSGVGGNVAFETAPASDILVRAALLAGRRGVRDLTEAATS